MSKAIPIQFRRLDPGAVLPSYAHPGDAGLDLTSAVDVEVGPGERALVPTGFAVAIPEGHAGLVLPRSGLASRHGLTLANAPGLIDAGYRGEVTCAVVNLDNGRCRSGGETGSPSSWSSPCRPWLPNGWRSSPRPSAARAASAPREADGEAD